MAHLVIDNTNNVIAASEPPLPESIVEFYAKQGCSVVTGAYEVGYDGRLYRAGEAPQKSPEQVVAEQKEQRRAELIAELDALDAKGARAARAVALAWANGDDAAGGDVEKLVEIEEQARALREEMGAL